MSAKECFDVGKGSGNGRCNIQSIGAQATVRCTSENFRDPKPQFKISGEKKAYR